MSSPLASTFPLPSSHGWFARVSCVVLDVSVYIGVDASCADITWNGA